jgi:pimeloyl-ACP methyl ester carboxylesterase
MTDDYDEFGFLQETAAELNLRWKGRPSVVRRAVDVGHGQMLSALIWGDSTPELIFLHGGGQNAHTWDSALLALDRPAVAFDLPGHGRSSRRQDRDYSPWKNAEAVEIACRALAPTAAAVIGMSLGGATTIRLAAATPELVRKAVIIDVTPGVQNSFRQLSRTDRGTVALVSDQPFYESLDAMSEAAIALSPNRTPQAVRRGVRHNAMKLPDGRWTWRYDLFGEGRKTSDFTPLWDDVSRIKAPAMLVRGGASKFVTDADTAEMKRRLNGLRIETVPGAGHAVQSDKPLELARLVEQFVFAD